MKVTSQRILEQVLRGLAQDLEQLQQLDDDFSSLMQDAREVSSRSFAGAPPAEWEEKWRDLVQAHEEARRHEAEARRLLTAPDAAPGAAKGAVEEWRQVEQLDGRLASLIDSLRAESRPAPGADHADEWERCWNALESYLEAIRAQVAAVTVKLEMHRRHGGPEAQRLTQSILSKLPATTEANPDSRAYQQAAEQLQHEWHEVGGFWDIIRSLLVYQDTPDERVMGRKSGESSRR